jgi:murein DD-endopeptidase MepM/ murein hydrolase activator NlpD
MSIADRFDSPVGSQEERDGPEIPPGAWYDSNPYGNYYYLGPGKTNPAYHPGADLLLWPGGGRGQPIYACANGVITFADRIKNPDGQWSSWGNVIIEECTLSDGSKVYVRYAHGAPLLVKAGDEVARGQQIASESDAFGRFTPHLHLDISLTAVILTKPGDWPGLNRERLHRDYVDPLVFIRKHREVVVMTKDQIIALAGQSAAIASQIAALAATIQEAPPMAPTKYYATVDQLNVRSGPGTNYLILKKLALGEEVTVTAISGDWTTISAPIAGCVYKGSLSLTRPT